MKSNESLDAKLKVCDKEIRHYVSALKKENERLQEKKAKLFVENESQKNEIKALKKLRPVVEFNVSPAKKPPTAGQSKKP